jgi:hypothetical protein
MQNKVLESRQNGHIEADIDQQIADLVEVIRANRSQIERYEAVIESAKAELRDLLEARGENWSDAEGYARLVAEGLRHLYDARTLDELIISDPQRYGWLADHRKDSPVPARVQVK